MSKTMIIVRGDPAGPAGFFAKLLQRTLSVPTLHPLSDSPDFPPIPEGGLVEMLRFAYEEIHRFFNAHNEYTHVSYSVFKEVDGVRHEVMTLRSKAGQVIFMTSDPQSPEDIREMGRTVMEFARKDAPQEGSPEFDPIFASLGEKLHAAFYEVDPEPERGKPN